MKKVAHSIEIELINFGRGKINKKVEVKNPSFSTIYKAIGEHLASKHFGINETGTEGLFDIEAGYRIVGQVKVPQSHWMLLM